MSTLDTLLLCAANLADVERETDPVPEWLAARAAQCAGKLITKRDAAALEAAFPGLIVMIRKMSYGTNIEWYASPTRWNLKDNERIDDPEGRALIAMGVPNTYSNSPSIRISEAATSARWYTADELRTRNPWAYSARDERNRGRDKSLELLTKADVSMPALAATIDALVLLAADYRAHLESVPDEVKRVAITMMKGIAIETRF